MIIRILTIVFITIYTICFSILVINSNNLYDTAWLITLLTLPVSEIAAFLSKICSGFFNLDPENIYVALVSLYIFGLIQYSIVGLVFGWILEKCFIKLRNFCKSPGFVKLSGK